MPSLALESVDVFGIPACTEALRTEQLPDAWTFCSQPALAGLAGLLPVSHFHNFPLCIERFVL